MNRTAIKILTTQFVVLAHGSPSKIREKRNEVRLQVALRDDFPHVGYTFNDEEGEE